SLDVTGTVIATGGSAVYSSEAMEKLASDATIIYLKVEKEELYRRLKDVKARGVVLHEGETLDEMFETRSVLYEKYANVTIEESGASIEDTVRQVVEMLK
ncbi:MAG: shikimate kinase, partial [Lachnospiraceae bacterium]|nr:shikimate kinase [Lachnospiraceae bacterium]